MHLKKNVEKIFFVFYRLPTYHSVALFLSKAFNWSNLLTNSLFDKSLCKPMYKKMNCWEFMKCGREAGGRSVDQLGICPAYPNYGQSCATVVGTFCDLVQVMRTSTVSDCQECPFYNSLHFDKNARGANPDNSTIKRGVSL